MFIDKVMSNGRRFRTAQRDKITVKSESVLEFHVYKEGSRRRRREKREERRRREEEGIERVRVSVCDPLLIIWCYGGSGGWLE
ncbi:hypothetical protein VNO78_02286 [Psophocarpus tetragonolobus]|uniref:Uncharacterized protein n=1 Tax=Psophocarpus tetragonolobus TaxID=3891 RepID=A0AAN9TBB1_PSOTE